MILEPVDTCRQTVLSPACSVNDVSALQACAIGVGFCVAVQNIGDRRIRTTIIDDFQPILVQELVPYRIMELPEIFPLGLQKPDIILYG